jgi:hypothetical protein
LPFYDFGNVIQRAVPKEEISRHIAGIGGLGRRKRHVKTTGKKRDD